MFCVIVLLELQARMIVRCLGGCDRARIRVRSLRYTTQLGDPMMEAAHSQNNTERRALLKAAAWSMPVVALASVAPSVSASTQPEECPTIGVHSIVNTWFCVTKIDKKHCWTPKSSGQVWLTLGHGPQNLGALSYSADMQGVSVDTHAMQVVVTYPFKVKWQGGLSGWSRSETQVKGGWRYTFVKDAPVVGTVAKHPLGDRPAGDSAENAVPLSEVLTGTFSLSKKQKVDKFYSISYTTTVQYTANSGSRSCGPETDTKVIPGVCSGSVQRYF